LCGEDQGSGLSYEHRRQWVEDSIAELAKEFAVAVWGYAVMSNHLHVVVEVIPQVAAAWSADEVAARWCRLYPRQNQEANARSASLTASSFHHGSGTRADFYVGVRSWVLCSS